MKVRHKILFFLLILILILILVYLYARFIGCKGFYVKEYKVESSTIAQDYNGLKIVHLSDIHYGSKSLTKEDLTKIVNDVNKTNPDIVVLTGDIINNSIDDKQYKELSELLNKINASIGKYAIDGNHDYNYSKWSQLVEDSGFINLNDQYEVIYSKSYSPILIAGISNNTYTTKNIRDKTETIFNYINSEECDTTYNILLMHEPDFVEDIEYDKFDIVLAGHSHNGQVRLPFIGAIFTPYGSKKYYDEYYKLNETDLFISSGIGTSELPIRLFNHPSYNLYRIIKK